MQSLSFLVWFSALQAFVLVWGYMHEREVERCDFEGPPKSNLALKTFELFKLKTELWGGKIPKNSINSNFTFLVSLEREIN